MMNNLEVLDYLCKQYEIDENVYKEFLEDTDINRNIWL